MYLNHYINYKIITEDTQDAFKRNDQSSSLAVCHNFDVKIKIQCQIDNKPESWELLPNQMPNQARNNLTIRLQTMNCNRWKEYFEWKTNKGLGSIVVYRN